MPVSCYICLELLLNDTKIAAGSCGHTFHSDCILKWLSNRHECPVCRHKLPRNDIIEPLYFRDNINDDDSFTQLKKNLDYKRKQLVAKDAELASAAIEIKGIKEELKDINQKYIKAQTELDEHKFIKWKLIHAKHVTVCAKQKLFLTRDEIFKKNDKIKILEIENAKLRAQNAEHKKIEDELLHELSVKNAKLKRNQQYQERSAAYGNSTPRPVMSDSFFANASTNITEDELAIPISTEGKHAKQITPVADEKNIVSASSSTKEFNSNNDSITRVGTNVSKGPKRVTVARARDLQNNKSSKKNRNAPPKKRKKLNKHD